MEVRIGAWKAPPRLLAQRAFGDAEFFYDFELLLECGGAALAGKEVLVE
jgi:hypothetical protein